MRGEIEAAGRAERVGIGVLADRLQRVADGGLGVAVVDHQRGAAVVHQAPAQLHRDVVGAPFEDRAVRRVAQRRRQYAVEVRDRIARDREHEPAGGIDADEALVPALFGPDRLMDRQCVEELVGEHDGGARRHIQSVGCQNIGVASGSSVRCCCASSAGLISTRWIATASRKPGITLAARSASFIMVPRPGPSSMTRRFSGEPIRFQIAAIQSPSISPNIWLTSGAVMKSPRAPNGSCVV